MYVYFTLPYFTVKNGYLNVRKSVIALLLQKKLWQIKYYLPTYNLFFKDEKKTE